LQNVCFRPLPKVICGLLLLFRMTSPALGRRSRRFYQVAT